jgi:hypothetical protein
VLSRRGYRLLLPSPPVAVMIRDKVRENSQKFLDPGEQIQDVFVAQTLSGWWAALSWLIMLFMSPYRAVVATDKRILVLKSGKFQAGNPKEVLRTLPRSTRIGQPSGLWWKFDTLGEKLFVHKRFHKDIEQIDARAA